MGTGGGDLDRFGTNEIGAAAAAGVRLDCSWGRGLGPDVKGSGRPTLHMPTIVQAISSQRYREGGTAKKKPLFPVIRGVDFASIIAPPPPFFAGGVSSA